MMPLKTEISLDGAEEAENSKSEKDFMSPCWLEVGGGGLNQAIQVASRS